MTNQLAIEIPVDHAANKTYAKALAEWMKGHENNTFLCYCATTKSYFVSKYFKKESIEKWYKSITIIK